LVVLVDFPFKNQNSTVLQDGSKDANGAFDCVPTSIAAGMQYLTGQSFEGGILKEIVYGSAWSGGQAANAYVQYCSHWNVHLYPVDGSPTTLIDQAHAHLQAGHPLLFTIDDPYVNTSLPQYEGWTHVIVLYGENPGYLSAMDPFIAKTVTKTDAAWQRDMRENEIWILERIDKPVAISLDTPGVSNYYEPATNGMWHCKVKGHDFIVGGGILTFYRTLGTSGLCGLTHLGLPTSNEYSLKVPGHPEIVAQDFERKIRVTYDPAHILDYPPGAGPVYLSHEEVIPIGVSVEQYNSLAGQLDTAKSQLVQTQMKLQKIKEDIA